MTKSRSNIRFYSGDIKQIQVDTSYLSIPEKIKRLKELQDIEAKAKKRMSGRFIWILLPILYALFHTLLMFVSIGNMSVIFKYGITFLVVMFASTMFIPIILPEKLEKKNIWKKWLMILVLSFAYVNFSKSAAVWMSTMVIISLLLLVVSLLYITLCRQGFSDIINYVSDEHKRLHNEVVTEIDRKALVPIKINYDIVLGKGEIPLIETDCILLEVRERQTSPTGASASHYLSTYTNAIFRNTDFLKKSVSENIYNIGQNIKNTALNVSAVQKKVYANTISNYSNNSQIKNNGNEIPKSEFIGKFILTQKRILFVGCPRGFQIFNKDIIAYGIDPMNHRNITFQSEKSIRVLSTDDNFWIKRYMDRIMNDGRIN